MVTDPFSGFDQPTRPESEGEKEVRWASNILTLAQSLGFKLTEADSLALAAFVLKVTRNLTPYEQQLAADLISAGIKWYGQKKPG